MNVEVYTADTVYLGAIAMESEVVAEGAQQAPLCTADLVLNVAAPEATLLAPTAVTVQRAGRALQPRSRFRSPSPARSGRPSPIRF